MTFTVLTTPGRSWLIKDCMRGSGAGSDMEVSLVGAGRTGSNQRATVTDDRFRADTTVSLLSHTSGLTRS
ncbi:hypothetical protein GCM10009639_27040 [Kitasatospora putterlickiae]|uniref:Uncharacterized protein n=1 Tax=Kitasatospora putterlickiae TaxID=221725 RepID=A0ABN1XZC6_9ACTN